MIPKNNKEEAEKESLRELGCTLEDILQNEQRKLFTTEKELRVVALIQRIQLLIESEHIDSAEWQKVVADSIAIVQIVYTGQWFSSIFFNLFLPMLRELFSLLPAERGGSLMKALSRASTNPEDHTFKDTTEYYTQLYNTRFGLIAMLNLLNVDKKQYEHRSS